MIRAFGRYIRYLLSLLDNASNALIERTRGSLFCTLFNMRSRLLGRSVRFRQDADGYQVTDPVFSPHAYRFRHEVQANMAYKKGLVRRAQMMGDTYLLEAIEFHEGDLVIDCGANVGDLKLWFTHRNLPVTYMAFEPSPLEFACLEKNVAPGTAHHCGLWKEDGNLTFYVSSQGADSSLIEPAEYDDVIHVTTRRLADFVDGPVKLLKLEAEGAEPEILLGVEEKLEQIEYISADLGYERGVRSESTFVPVTNYLLSRGFEMVDISRQRMVALYRNTSVSR
ncbi:MAG: FkbM family methyltransferase [Ketobacteraceae bacterium]|nr:FkbM family methyltransferase [Ketobacteraceae bacterium]